MRDILIAAVILIAVWYLLPTLAAAAITLFVGLFYLANR